MIVLILGLGGVVLFVTGIIFIMRGYADSPDINSVVKKEELDKTRGDLLNARKQEEGLKLQLDTIALELDKARDRITQAQKLESSVHQLSIQEVEYKQKVQELEAHLQFLTNKADTQAQEAVAALSSLDAENTTLKTSVEQIRSQFDPQAIEKLQTENNKLRQSVDENLSKIRTLQSDLEVTENQSRTKIKEADATIQSLSADNSKIKDGLHQITTRISEVEGELMRSEKEGTVHHEQSAVLESQVGSLQKQIAENQAQMQSLEAELTKSREQATQAAQAVEQLKKEKETLSARPTFSAPVSGNWPQEKNSMEDQLARLKQFNLLLTEKEKILQSELTRSRMKALNWEKIAEALKTQTNQK